MVMPWHCPACSAAPSSRAGGRRRKLSRDLAFLEPTRGQRVGLRLFVEPHQNGQLLFVGEADSGFRLVHQRGTGRLAPAALVLHQLAVRAAQRLHLVRQPLGLAVEQFFKQPKCRLVLAAPASALAYCCCRLKSGGNSAASCPSSFRASCGLAGLMQVVHALLPPRFLGEPVCRLAVKDGLQGVQQPQHLVGFEDAGRLAEQVIGQEEIIPVTPLSLWERGGGAGTSGS